MRLVRIFSLVLVMVLSLLLLLCVGWGEARRVYEELQLKTLSAQGEAVRELMERFLRDTWPLTDVTRFLDPKVELARYAGFSTFTAAGQDRQDTRTITVFDTQGKQVFPTNKGDGSGAPCVNHEVSSLPYAVCGDEYRLTFQLHNASQRVGSMVVTMPVSIVTDLVKRSFARVSRLAISLILVFIGLIYLIERRGRGSTETTQRYAYAITFTAMAVVLTFTLLDIYKKGAQARTDAAAHSFGLRLSAIVKPGTDLGRFEPLLCEDFQTFLEGKEISMVALMVKGREDQGLLRRRATDSCRSVRGEPNLYATDSWWFGDYEKRIAVGAESLADLTVVLPGSVVREKVLRSAKNFAALFFACGLLSFLLLTVMTSFQRVQDLQFVKQGRRPAMGMADQTLSGYLSQEQDFWLNVMRAVGFLAIFAEGLNASFLPQYLQSITAAADLSEFLAATLFTAFFAAFVLILVPAGWYAENREIKHLLLAGATFIATGMLVMAISADFYVLLLARVLGGMGQGMTFIGVQSYILVVTSADRRTQGSAKQVFAQNSGVISGAAIGALVVGYLRETDIFIAGSLITCFTFSFIWWVIPKVGWRARLRAAAAQPSAKKSFLGRTKVLLRDSEFTRTFLLVGIASKIVYNGVVFYAIPLIMKQQDYLQEDIGQALMLFAGAVLVTNHYVSKLADRFGSIARILFVGMLISGAGGISIGLTESAASLSSVVPHLNQVALFSGIIILGIANGFIAAPVVSYVLSIQAATALGGSSTAAVYRVLERAGHVLGPLILGQMLIWNGRKASAVGMVGAFTLVCGLIFFAFHQRSDSGSKVD